MTNGYGSSKNKTMDILEFKETGCEQSLEQYRGMDYSNPNGDWNRNGNGLYRGKPEKGFGDMNP